MCHPLAQPRHYQPRLSSRTSTGVGLVRPLPPEMEWSVHVHHVGQIERVFGSTPEARLIGPRSRGRTPPASDDDQPGEGTATTPLPSARNVRR